MRRKENPPCALLEGIQHDTATMENSMERERESCSVVSNSVTPWSIQSIEFSRPEYWSG